MIKSLLTLILSACFFLTFAQKKDTSIYYLTKLGQVVSTKDNADYIMFILPKNDTNLFPVKVFYKNGKTRSTGYSITNNSWPKYQGVLTLFDTNEHKSRELNFSNDSPIVIVTAYFPNGKLYYVKYDTPVEQPVLFKECRDSTGKILVHNGNGIWKEYFDQKFDGDYIEGEVVSDLQQGQWKATLKDNSQLVLNYKDGYYDFPNADHKLRPILQRLPHFPGGEVEFNQFISRNIHLPEEAKRNGISGKVMVSFLVDIDGSISNIKVAKGIGGGCDEEAIRVVKLFPPWRPSIQNNEFFPMNITIPITF
jgi:TonB family protein